ncbi:MAG: TIGR04282 family arsenosugar biosynthesis glycosyltransferase [Proteobacteria bacterium]|nr:TIGR04282 family arsenosugar biosynthesis glycosyltransferase [Pseudomonadota bacterium]
MAKQGAIVVFAKAPRAGLVKTRMCPPLTSEQAASLYEHMLDDVLEATADFAAALGLDPLVAIYPADGVRDVLPRTPGVYRIIAQRGRDLSQRMDWAAAEVAASGASPILLRGSDSPVLSQACVEDALRALRESDVVLCPDADGGYNLVGLCRPRPGLFDHAMSTESVLDDTLAAAEAMGLRATLLEPGFDIDTAADLALLERARAAGQADLCPRTLAYLDERGLWSPAC